MVTHQVMFNTIFCCRINNICFLSTTNIFISLFIAGLESAKSKNYEEAFTCFLAGAQQGYSKAHFNTGVCYEKGRGATMDKEKVWFQTGHFSFSGVLHHSEHILRWFSCVFFWRLCITTGRQQLGVTHRPSTAMQSCYWPAGVTRA